MKKNNIYKLCFFTLTLCLIFQSNVSNSQTTNWDWAKSQAGNYDDYANSVSVDIEGNSIITGVFNSDILYFGSTALLNSGFSDIFIAKLDESGNTIWAKRAGGTDSEYSNCLEIDIDGNVFIVGEYKSSNLNFGTTNLYNSTFSNQVFIVKFDATGDELWAKSGGGDYDDNVCGLALDINGCAYISGNFESSSVDFGLLSLTNSSIFYSSDLYVVKYDENGIEKWAINASGNGNDNASSLAVLIDETVIIVGEFEGQSLNFGNITIDNSEVAAPYTDIFIAKLSQGTVSMSDIADNSKFVIYPNPSNDIFNIELSDIKNTTKGSLSIYDNIGKVIYYEDIDINGNTFITQLDISNYENGIYFIKIENEGSRVIKSIIKN